MISKPVSGETPLLDYDSITPFRQILAWVRRRQELRAVLRTGYEIGGGLQGVDSSLIVGYVHGSLHVTRLAALRRRLAHDEEFRGYAEPHIAFAEELRFLSTEERMSRWHELDARRNLLPTSPPDRKDAAWLAHHVLLAKIRTVDDNVTYYDEDDGWSTGFDLDRDIELELEKELLEPLEIWDPRDVREEALEYAMQLYMDGLLRRYEQRVVEARALRDPAFRERWAALLLPKLERRLVAAERRREERRAEWERTPLESIQ